MRDRSLDRAVSLILAPLIRPSGLEALRVIDAAGERGVIASEVEAALDLAAVGQIHTVVGELTRARAVAVGADNLDSRRHRIRRTANAPGMIAIGDGLTAWIASARSGTGPPVRPDHSGRPLIPREPVNLIKTMWGSGLAPSLNGLPLTVGEVAARLESGEAGVRHIVDRAVKVGLLAKTPGPGGRNLLSLTPLFGRHIPVAARLADYLARAFGLKPDFIPEPSIRTALGELLGAIQPKRPLFATIALRVHRINHEAVDVVAFFREGQLISLARGGDYRAKIESDMPGWIRFLAASDRSQLNWSGRGALSVIEAIEDLEGS